MVEGERVQRLINFYNEKFSTFAYGIFCDVCDVLLQFKPFFLFAFGCLHCAAGAEDEWDIPFVHTRSCP